MTQWPLFPRTVRAAILALLVTVTVPLFAQSSTGPWPLPSRTANTPILCSPPTCSDPKLTAPWTPPLQFVGRYFDHNGQRQRQEPLRDLRANYVQASPNGIYAQLNGVIVAYDPGTFFARLAAGEPMIPVTQIQGAIDRGAFPETLLRPRNFWNPRTDPVWFANSTQADGDIRIFRFDIDPRGYVYPFTDAYGWGILDSQLQTLSHEAQINARGGGAWIRSGSSYYHLVTPENGNSRIYDVTDPQNPRFIGPASYAATLSAHTANGDTAIVDSAGDLHIFTATDQPTGVGRVEHASGKEHFYSVASDGASFFASETEVNGETEIAVLSAPTYSRSDVGIGSTFTSPTSIISGGGYIALSGNEQAIENGVFWGAPNLRLFKIGPSNSLIAVPLPTGSAMGAKVNHFFVNYYHKPTAETSAGYTAPSFTGFGLNAKSDCALIPAGGVVNLIMTAGALGDVWAIGTATQPPVQPPVIPPTQPPTVPPGATFDVGAVQSFLSAAQQAITNAQAVIAGATVPPVQPPPVVPPQPPPPVIPPTPPPIVVQPPPPPSHDDLIGKPCDRTGVSGVPLPDGFACQGGKVVKL